MPLTRFITLQINDTQVDLPNIEEGQFEFKMSYLLEEPENFMSRQGADPYNITVPATIVNDKIFNTYFNPQVEDLVPDTGAIESAHIAVSSDGGFGWVVGDLFAINGFGTQPAVGKVLTTSGGAMTSFTLIERGNGYSVGITTSYAITGIGTSCSPTITAVYSTTASPREYMPSVFYINGTTPIFNGYALLTAASYTDKPEAYELSLYSASSQWIIDMQNITMWDCVNPNSHNFTVSVIETSWANYNAAGDGTDDYVYAPVRYRQPFDGTTLGYQGDNCVNIYHLRPSISLYWLIYRAFQQIGYSISSQFFATRYFQNLVLPWVWGDFYDLNSQLIQGICFKASGELPSPSEPPPATNSVIPFWSGSASGTVGGSAGGSSWWNNSVNSGWNPGAYTGGLATLTNGINAVGGVYVFDGSGTSGAGLDWFKMDISNPPNGYDNFLLYSFDAATGTMIYDFNPPDSLVGTLINVSATFVINLYAVVTTFVGTEGLLAIECVQIPAIGPTVTTCQSIMPTGGARVGFGTYPDNSGYPSTPTACSFTVPNMNPGDQLRFRIRALASGGNITVGVFSGGYLNNNPAVLGVPSFSYNPVTQQFGYFTPNLIWSPLQSSFTMTGFLIQLGNAVNLKNYDAFRNFQFLDLLGGVIDMFNLEVATDSINKVITIEPEFGSTLPTLEAIDGYFSLTKIFDWSSKRDYSVGKGSKLTLFNQCERQIDLTFKLDASDGGQTVWAQRNKDIYLNNRTYTGGFNQNNVSVSPGIIAGVPGAARYMLPNRFVKGNKQLTNRFFSAVMHVPFPQWINVNAPTVPLSPATQLIAIYSQDNSNDAYAQTFTPKLAYYGGKRAIGTTGGWIWIGDPAAPYSDATARAFDLPHMCAVNYIESANTYPVLSYSDEIIDGRVVNGLMSQFYRQRFAIMRNGQLLEANLRLNLNDVCNWFHRELIMIDGTLYALIQIDGYNPLTDESTSCTLWKVVLPQEVDVANSYPSRTSILNYKTITSLPNSFDLRYAPLLLYPTDVPQIS